MKGPGNAGDSSDVLFWRKSAQPLQIEESQHLLSQDSIIIPKTVTKRKMNPSHQRFELLFIQ
jgi:hypothetical protein